MQHSVMFRVKDTTALQRRVFETCLALGRPVAERRLANGGRFASVSDRLLHAVLWLVCFRSLQRFLGLDRVREGFCGGATVSPEVLLFFWILGIQGPVLWGVLMAFLSLLPAVGAGLIWLPVAIYFIATGGVWQGVILIAYGVFVIGLVDNVLRPILVGKDTKMPDYVVLISTLGGMALFGLTGFVIGPVIAALFIATWDLFAPSVDNHSSPP